MPQFHLEHGTDRAAYVFSKLDSFMQGYIEAMFFTDADADSDDCAGATTSDLAPEALSSIIGDCEDFRASLPKDGHGRTWLDLAYDYAPAEYDETMAGRDFWYTRNGHGVGFWDRGLGEVGRKLSDACKSFRNLDLYRGDDGKVYL